MPSGQDWSPKFAVFGDMGNDNVIRQRRKAKSYFLIIILFIEKKQAQSLPRLIEETKQGDYDAILHIGDFAYDMANVRTNRMDFWKKKFVKIYFRLFFCWF